MRIYQVNIEHKKWGLNYSTVKVAARDFEEAVKKAKASFNNGELVESVELLASED